MRTRRTRRNRSIENETPPPRRGGVSFVMTLWLEPREMPAEPEWRWRVTEVATGEQRYFRRLSDLLAHVSEKTGVSPPT
jgi:hypothetical protein